MSKHTAAHCYVCRRQTILTKAVINKINFVTVIHPALKWPTTSVFNL